MSNVKIELSKYFIPSSILQVCLIDGATKEYIINQYPSRVNGPYYLNKFINYLCDSHHIDIIEYCKKYLNFEWPKCPNTNELVGFKITGRGLMLSKFKKGHISKKTCEAFKESCEKLSVIRKGEGNPMFGRISWQNKIDKNSSSYKKYLKKMSKPKGSPTQETKNRQSVSAKNRKIHGHTGIKHSIESKEKMRISTAKRYEAGLFKRETSIHTKMREFLNSLDLKEIIREEFFIDYYSLDFAFPLAKIGVECQGTYFHIDPRVYPNGPINAVQRRNFGRDNAKFKYLNDKGWIIIPVWETEINDNTFKENILCNFKKLKLLKK